VAQTSNGYAPPSAFCTLHVLRAAAERALSHLLGAARTRREWARVTKCASFANPSKHPADHVVCKPNRDTMISSYARPSDLWQSCAGEDVCRMHCSYR